MTAPVRLRLSRAKGFDLQVHSRATNGLPAIVVARPGPFGNPCVVGRHGTRDECVNLHAHTLNGLLPFARGPDPGELRACLSNFKAQWRELSGRNLACWCALDGPCHADTLIEAVAIMEKRT